jgi:hypothetical protein
MVGTMTLWLPSDVVTDPVAAAMTRFVEVVEAAARGLCSPADTDGGKSTYRCGLPVSTA